MPREQKYATARERKIKFLQVRVHEQNLGTLETRNNESCQRIGTKKQKPVT